jgi:hypothetical protein
MLVEHAESICQQSTAMSSNQTMMIFRFTKRDHLSETVSFLKSFREGQIATTTLLHEALDVKDRTIAAVVEIMDTIAVKTLPENTVDLVEVQITTTMTPIDENSGEILEHRRRKALGKLTLADIQALGVEKLATYDKVKFHNAPEEE